MEINYDRNVHYSLSKKSCPFLQLLYKSLHGHALFNFQWFHLILISISMLKNIKVLIYICFISIVQYAYWNLKTFWSYNIFHDFDRKRTAYWVSEKSCPIFILPFVKNNHIIGTVRRFYMGSPRKHLQLKKSVCFWHFWYFRSLWQLGPIS